MGVVTIIGYDFMKEDSEMLTSKQSPSVKLWGSIGRGNSFRL